MSLDTEELIQYVQHRFHVLRQNHNFLNVGCGSGGALKFISKVIKGRVYGVEFDPRFRPNLNTLESEYGVKVFYENPLKEEFWNSVRDLQIDVFLNTLNLGLLKSFQVIELALPVIAKGGKLVNIYSVVSGDPKKSMVKEFLNRMGLKDTILFEFSNRLGSISTKVLF